MASLIQNSVYCILIAHNPTIKIVKESYYQIFIDVKVENIDLFFLVDGGSDLVMTGNETELGSVVEDHMHLQVVNSLTQILQHNKYAIILGADVDCAHGIILSELINRLRQLESDTIDKYELTENDEYFQQYKSVFEKCDPINSIVQSLVIASVENNVGQFTPHHLIPRIRENKITLNKRICTMYTFPLTRIYNDVVYISQLTDDMDTDAVDSLIDKITNSHGTDSNPTTN